MARGHQKAVSQQKAAQKNKDQAKQKGHSASAQAAAAQKALVFSCAVCRVCSFSKKKQKTELLTIFNFLFYLCVTVPNARSENLQAAFRK